MSALKDIDFGTHSYVGSLPCGCGVAITRDMPQSPKEVARDVAAMIKAGEQVQRLPHKDACEVFAARCADYPHEEWQKRHEAARAVRRESAQAVDAVGQPTANPTFPVRD